MFDVDGIILFVSCIIFTLCAFIIFSLIGIIYDKVVKKISFREWLRLRKYPLLIFLLIYLGSIYVAALLAFGFWGAVAGIPITMIISFIAIPLILSNRAKLYRQEDTPYICNCGKKIVKIIAVKPSGKQKTKYYICRFCGRKYTETTVKGINP